MHIHFQSKSQSAYSSPEFQPISFKEKQQLVKKITYSPPLETPDDQPASPPEVQLAISVENQPANQQNEQPEIIQKLNLPVTPKVNHPVR